MKLSDIHKEIDILSDKVDSLCHSPVAKSLDEADKWMKNPKSHYLEKIRCVDPLPIGLEVDINHVVGIWMEYQNRRIDSLDIFIKKIDKIDRLIKGNEDWVRALLESHLFSEGDVRNISHVELFAFQLPSASPSNATKYKRIGVAMAGLFFIEKLGKYQFNNPKASSKNPYDEIFNLDKIKALYDIASDFQDE